MPELIENDAQAEAREAIPVCGSPIACSRNPGSMPEPSWWVFSRRRGQPRGRQHADRRTSLARAAGRDLHYASAIVDAMRALLARNHGMPCIRMSQCTQLYYTEKRTIEDQNQFRRGTFCKNQPVFWVFILIIKGYADVNFSSMYLQLKYTGETYNVSAQPVNLISILILN